MDSPSDTASRRPPTEESPPLLKQPPQQAQELIHLPEDYQVSPQCDVICGRGRGNSSWHGNLRFTDIVDSYRQRYVDAPKEDKTTVLADICHVVRFGKPPTTTKGDHDDDNHEDNRPIYGRFIKALDDSSALWGELKPRSARNKAAHAMQNVIVRHERYLRQLAKAQANRQAVNKTKRSRGLAENGSDHAEETPAQDTAVARMEARMEDNSDNSAGCRDQDSCHDTINTLHQETKHHKSSSKMHDNRDRNKSSKIHRGLADDDTVPVQNRTMRCSSPVDHGARPSPTNTMLSTAVPPPPPPRVVDETSPTQGYLENGRSISLAPPPTEAAEAAGPRSTSTRPPDPQLKWDETMWLVVPASALSSLLYNPNQQLDLEHPEIIWTGRTAQYLIPSTSTTTLAPIPQGGGEPLHAAYHRPPPTALADTTTMTPPPFHRPHQFVSVQVTPPSYEKSTSTTVGPHSSGWW